MAFRRHLQIVLAWTFSSLLAADAQIAKDSQPAGSELERQRATFQDALQKINDTDLADRVTIQNQFLKSLEHVEKQFQTAGKLEPILAVRKERARFEQARDIAPEDMSAVPEIKACQAVFLRDRDAMPVVHARRVVLLSQQYDQALAKLQEALVKKGDVDTAITVKGERESFSDNLTVKDAYALVAAADAKAKTKKQAQKPLPVTTSTTLPPPKVEKNVKKYSGKPEYYIRARFEKLCDAILDQDWEKASAYADPVFIKRRGADGVVARMRIIFPFLQGLANLPQGKIKGGDVKIDQAGTGAILTPKAWVHDRWNELPNQRWVEVDGDWYLEIEPVR